MNIQTEVTRAYDRIYGRIRETPAIRSEFYSAGTGAEVYLKTENLQLTGSFKVRGAMNKLLTLPKDELNKGVITASTGNHGAAVAYSLKALNATGVVFVSENASASKIANIERLGAEVRYFGEDPIEAERHAREYAREKGLAYISPYNDEQIIAGQGTIGVELVDQLEDIDAVFVSVGGGGLVSGLGGYLKSVKPATEIIGCSPQNSMVMVESIRQGKIVDIPSLPTLSDGTAGGIDEDAITFGLCRKYVDRFVTVTEQEIAGSLREFIDAHHMLIEGSAAVAIASFLKISNEFNGKNVVIILCGANIGAGKLKEVL